MAHRNVVIGRRQLHPLFNSLKLENMFSPHQLSGKIVSN